MGTSFTFGVRFHVPRGVHGSISIFMPKTGSLLRTWNGGGKNLRCWLVIFTFTLSLSLTKIAIDSGGSSSFEWPRWCSGWEEVDGLTLMITKFSMFSTYPCGCAFNLTIKEKKPFNPWRIVTTDERVAVEMDMQAPKGI